MENVAPGKQDALEQISSLIARGKIDVNERDSNGQTLLFQACRQGNLNLAVLLVDCGAYVNARDNYNSTPLHKAVEEGFLRIALFLLKNGADVNSKNNYGITPQIIAKKKKLITIQILLWFYRLMRKHFSP